jgi:FkbM family methyltransferase
MTSRHKELKSLFAAGELSKADFIILMHRELHSILFDYSDLIGNTDISKIEIGQGEVLMTSRIDGITLAVDAEDHRTAPIEIINFGSYEPEETKVIRRIARQMSTMLDIGANIGWYSLMSASINSNSTIHAFEPIPSTFKRLEKNCRLNGLESKIYCHNYGFSGQPGSFPFYFYPQGSGNASMQNLGERENVTIVDCELRTLDSVLDWITPSKYIDFIKCDVEGNELFVLQGGRELLARHKPILLLELLRKWSAKFGYHPNDAIIFLEELGYKCYTTTFEGSLAKFSRINEDTMETNFFFVHPESRLKDCAGIL